MYIGAAFFSRKTGSVNSDFGFINVSVIFRVTGLKVVSTEAAACRNQQLVRELF
jgi:hypothetical protein